MRIKEFLKPSVFKVIMFLFVGVFYLYLAKEEVSAVGLYFSMNYKTYGFPFSYMVTGNIDAASDYTSTLFLGSYFSKFGKVLLNPAALMLNAISIYLLSCLISMLLFKKELKS